MLFVIFIRTFQNDSTSFSTVVLESVVIVRPELIIKQSEQSMDATVTVDRYRYRVIVSAYRLTGNTGMDTRTILHNTLPPHDPTLCCCLTGAPPDASDVDLYICNKLIVQPIAVVNMNISAITAKQFDRIVFPVPTSVW